MLRLTINTESLIIATSWIASPQTPTKPAGKPDLVVGNTIPVEVYFIDGNGDYAPFSGDMGYALRLGIGLIGGVEGGQWRVQDDFGQTGLLAYNVAATALQAALNALNAGAGPQGGTVAVTSTHDGYYDVRWDAAGARDPLLVDADLLTPEATGVVEVLEAGDGATRARQLIRLVRQPAALTDGWSQVVDPTTSAAIGFSGFFDLRSPRVRQLLKNAPSMSVMLECDLRDPSDRLVTRLQTPARLLNATLDAESTAPEHFPASSSRYLANRAALDSLTSGSNALNALATTLLPDGYLAALELANGRIDLYRLEAGTDAESLPDVVRPLDYHATANARVWRLKLPGVPEPMGYTDGGTLAGAGTTTITPAKRVATWRFTISGAANDIRNILIDDSAGTPGDVVLIRLQSGSVGSGTMLVRASHNAAYPVFAGATFHAGKNQHFLLTFCKNSDPLQTWRLMAATEMNPMYSDPVFPVGPNREIAWFKGLWTELDALADGATVTTDCNESNVFEVTLAGNRTLANPINLHNGQTLLWVIRQDATGSRTLTYGSAFKFPGGTPPVLSTAANAVDVLTGVVTAGAILCSLQKHFL